MSLFTNVPLDETFTILANKAFTENWFHETYNLNIMESDLGTLLQLAKKDQLFQFEGNLYQQIDGVAMGFSKVNLSGISFIVGQLTPMNAINSPWSRDKTLSQVVTGHK